MELLINRDERVPDDTIFDAPLGNSFGLLHSPMPIICGTRSSNHIIHCRPIHSWHRVGGAQVSIGEPTAPVEKLQIVDTRRILSIAWTSTAKRMSLKPHIWRPP